MTQWQKWKLKFPQPDSGDLEGMKSTQSTCKDRGLPTPLREGRFISYILLLDLDKEAEKGVIGFK